MLYLRRGPGATIPYTSAQFAALLASPARVGAAILGQFFLVTDVVPPVLYQKNAVGTGADTIVPVPATPSWPTSLNVGLLYRYDGSVPESITLAGSEVVAWADQGPAGLDLTRTGVGASPTYSDTGLGGGPCIQFDWAGDKLLRVCAVAYGATGTTTLAAVYRPRPALAGNVLVHYDNSLVGLSLADEADPGSVIARTHRNNDPPTTRANSVRVAQSLIVTLGADSSVRRDGVIVTTAAANGAPVDVGASGRLGIGGDNRFDTNNTDAVALVACWDRALSADERADYATYVASRWVF